MSQPTKRLPYGEGREALMSAVIDTVADKGLRGVTYRGIASRAGVNHTLITHHFGSIEGLLAATMQWAVERSIRETGLERVVDFDEAFADSLVATVSREPELHFFQFEMLLESRRNPDVRRLVESLYASYMNAVERAFRSRGYRIEGEAALAIFAALDGLMLHFLTISEPGKIRAAVLHIAGMVANLRHVGAEEE